MNTSIKNLFYNSWYILKILWQELKKQTYSTEVVQMSINATHLFQYGKLRKMKSIKSFTGLSKLKLEACVNDYIVLTMLHSYKL